MTGLWHTARKPGSLIAKHGKKNYELTTISVACFSSASYFQTEPLFCSALAITARVGAQNALLHSNAVKTVGNVLD